MAWTQADIDRLQEAIARAGNVVEVRYADHSTRFMAPKEAGDLLALMKREVAKSSGRQPKRQIRVNTGSGL